MLTKKEIDGLDDKAIGSKVKEMRTDLFNLYMQKKTSGLEKSRLLRETRKDIARLLTVLNGRVKR